MILRLVPEDVIVPDTVGEDILDTPGKVHVIVELDQQTYAITVPYTWEAVTDAE